MMMFILVISIEYLIVTFTNNQGRGVKERKGKEGRKEGKKERKNE
jgi:hypothetical protein